MTEKKKESGKPKTEAPAFAAAAAEKPNLDLGDAAVLAVAFLAGAALMTLEIVGGRIIAARFGSHVFVWGGLIGIFMGALSLGYFLGGRAADRYPRAPALGVVLLLAGGAFLLVPPLSGPVCRLVGGLFFVKNVELANRWNPTFAIVVIFTVPSVLLGSISPFAVRLLVREVGTIGRVTARVYAVNAIGSIAGTLLTAFFFMGVWGNTAILVGTGVFLLAVGGSVLGLGFARAGTEPSPGSGRTSPAGASDSGGD